MSTGHVLHLPCRALTRLCLAQQLMRALHLPGSYLVRFEHLQQPAHRRWRLPRRVGRQLKWGRLVLLPCWLTNCNAGGQHCAAGALLRGPPLKCILSKDNLNNLHPVSPAHLPISAWLASRTVRSSTCAAAAATSASARARSAAAAAASAALFSASSACLSPCAASSAACAAFSFCTPSSLPASRRRSTACSAAATRLSAASCASLTCLLASCRAASTRFWASMRAPLRAWQLVATAWLLEKLRGPGDGGKGRPRKAR